MMRRPLLIGIFLGLSLNPSFSIANLISSEEVEEQIKKYGCELPYKVPLEEINENLNGENSYFKRLDKFQESLRNLENIAKTKFDQSEGKHSKAIELDKDENLLSMLNTIGITTPQNQTWDD